MSKDTFIVFCCDQNYFPLAKGTLLSIQEGGLGEGLAIGFIDLGCDAGSLEWLARHGVKIARLDRSIMGELADARFGYRRAMVCRPFLPALFPEAEVLIWIDCDAWVQDTSILSVLRRAVKERPSKIFIAPECHYTYDYINDRSVERRNEILSYYGPTFGAEIASRMTERPILNSGFFAMSATNAMWKQWGDEVTRLYVLDNPAKYTSMLLHMAEQSAINVVCRRQDEVVLIDPLYNYMCLWCPPVRDQAGIVRIALPPHLPVGVVHLAGGWQWYGAGYQERGLLYRSGDYLTEAEKHSLYELSRGRSHRA
jgi:lipopolysaccharide biosynthesis glycosyltransferase